MSREPALRHLGCETSLATKKTSDVTVIRVERGDQVAFEYWEAGAVPRVERASAALDSCIASIAPAKMSEMMCAPFLDRTAIKEQQLECAIRMARLAFEEIPVYRDKYQAANVEIAKIDSWGAFSRLPIMTKQALQAAGLSCTVNPILDPFSLYATRSSGASGSTLDIRIDAEALATDTIQGVRQLYLQSGLGYLPSDEAVFIYTVPWPTPSIAEDYLCHFVSSLIPPDRIADILAERKPSVLSIYPSVLRAILPFKVKWLHSNLKLIVVHSEQSTAVERIDWADACDSLVLDEYSSEEATRIALEFPCGHYHVCEDTVVVEIVDPITLEPVADGELGLVVVTNLLNTAMPFVRYLQGDIASIRQSSDCNIGWTQLSSLEGRTNDAFITASGRIIPSGTILDVTYRMMFDNGLSINGFVLVQDHTSHVTLYVKRSFNNVSLPIETIRTKLKTLLEVAMEQRVDVRAIEVERLPFADEKKRRPIRRAFGIPGKRVVPFRRQ